MLNAALANQYGKWVQFDITGIIITMITRGDPWLTQKRSPILFGQFCTLPLLKLAVGGSGDLFWAILSVF